MFLIYLNYFSAILLFFCFLVIRNNESMVIVNASPSKDKKVGISEKNSTPKIMVAIDSPPAARIDDFPVSIWIKATV